MNKYKKSPTLEFLMLATIENHFLALPDERQQYKVRYPVLDLVVLFY